MASSTEVRAEPAGAPATRADERLNIRSSIPFFAVHLVPLLAIFTGITRTALVLFVVTYCTRVFFITGGYHRYFAHRSYKMARVPQFLMALGGTMAVQKGPLWWAAHHRDHHRYSDTENDVHSPIRGFWWSHVGWILCDRYGESRHDRISDLAKYPELRFIDRNDWIGPWLLGITCYLIGGWSGLVFGFFASTVLLWHVTFCVNSVAHVFGRRAYATDDTEARRAAAIAAFSAYPGAVVRRSEHPSRQLLDRPALLGRAASASYLPAEGPEAKRLRQDLEIVFDRHARDGVVEVKIVTYALVADWR